MTTFDYRSIVTVVDVMDSGARIDGVLDVVSANKGIISDDPSKHPDTLYIQLSAGDGYGYGDRYGYGNGDGYGYGDGDGYGDGSMLLAAL